VGLYFGLVGCLCVVFAVWLFVRRLRVQFFGVLTDGFVGGHVIEEMDDSEHLRFTVTYFDAAGNMHQFSSVASMSAKIAIAGTKVSVRYLPSNPEHAYITGFLQMWAAPIALSIMGAAGILAWWYP
jgi:hypothetical protein